MLPFLYDEIRFHYHHTILNKSTIFSIISDKAALMKIYAIHYHFELASRFTRFHIAVEIPIL